MIIDKSTLSKILLALGLLLLIALFDVAVNDGHSDEERNALSNADKTLTTEDVKKSRDKRYEGQIYYKDRPFTGIFYSKDKKCCWNVSGGFPEKVSIKDIEGDINAEMVFEKYNGFITVYHPNNFKAIDMKVPLGKSQAITEHYFNTSGVEISRKDFRELCPKVWNVHRRLFAIEKKYEEEIKEKEDKSWW